MGLQATFKGVVQFAFLLVMSWNKFVDITGTRNKKDLNPNSGLVCAGTTGMVWTGTVTGFQLECVAVLDWNTQLGVQPRNVWLPSLP